MASPGPWSARPGCYLLVMVLLGCLVGLDTLRAPGHQWTARAYDKAARGYQSRISPHLARHVRCRFMPSCSQYSREAVAKHGLWRGLLLTAKRLSRCRPAVPLGTVDGVESVRAVPVSSPRLPGMRLVCLSEALAWAAAAPVLAELGSSEAALRASDRSLALARCVDHPRSYPTLLLLRGLLFFQLGRYDSAAEAGRLAIESSKESGSSLSVAAGHSLLAMVETDRANFGAAAAELEKARRAAEKANGRGFDGASQSLVEGLAPLLLMHVYTMELESSSAADSVAREFLHPLPPQEQQARGAIAQLILSLSRTAHRGLIGTRNHWNLGKVRRWLRPFVDGRNRARGQSALPGESVDLCACELDGQRLTPQAIPVRRSPFLDYRALLAELTGQQQRALLLSERETLTALASGDGDRAALALMQRARIYLTSGRHREAIDSAARALACIDQAAAKTRSVEWMGSSSSGVVALWVQGFLFELLGMVGREQEAFYVTERSRSRALLESIAGRANGAGNLPESAAAGDLAALQVEMRRVERELVEGVDFQRTQLERRLAALRMEFEGLRVRTAIRSSEFASVVSAEATTVAALQAELDPDVSLVSYYFADSGLYAWVIEHDSFAAFTLESPTTDLTAVPCFADFVRRGRGAQRIERRCADGQVLSESLYRQLIAPLRGAIHHSRLILVPHGQLHFVPFGALRNPETGRLLVEDFTITHAPSASVLQFLREKESPFAGRALVLGDPTTTDTRLERLPASGLEAAVVAGLFGTVPRLGPMASETELDRLAGDIDVLHLAAHGVYFPASPRFSRIALAPGGGQDGNLEVHEICSRLDLKGVNLVVLSACDTALGERTGGDEIVGLTRAFLYAGASGVVSTLWQVDDQASTDLMVSFYLHLKSAETAAEALRHAQLEMMNRPGRENPYFWSGFVLTGDPQARWVEKRNY